MREYISFVAFAWCCAWWSASVYYFVVNWRKHKNKFGNLHLPVIVFTGVFSPGLVIAEMILSLGKGIKKRLDL